MIASVALTSAGVATQGTAAVVVLAAGRVAVGPGAGVDAALGIAGRVALTFDTGADPVDAGPLHARLAASAIEAIAAMEAIALDAKWAWRTAVECRSALGPRRGVDAFASRGADFAGPAGRIEGTLRAEPREGVARRDLGRTTAARIADSARQQAGTPDAAQFARALPVFLARLRADRAEGRSGATESRGTIVSIDAGAAPALARLALAGLEGATEALRTARGRAAVTTAAGRYALAEHARETTRAARRIRHIAGRGAHAATEQAAATRAVPHGLTIDIEETPLADFEFRWRWRRWEGFRIGNAHAQLAADVQAETTGVTGNAVRVIGLADVIGIDASADADGLKWIERIDAALAAGGAGRVVGVASLVEPVALARAAVTTPLDAVDTGAILIFLAAWLAVLIHADVQIRVAGRPGLATHPSTGRRNATAIFAGLADAAVEPAAARIAASIDAERRVGVVAVDWTEALEARHDLDTSAAGGADLTNLARPTGTAGGASCRRRIASRRIRGASTTGVTDAGRGHAGTSEANQRFGATVIVRAAIDANPPERRARARESDFAVGVALAGGTSAEPGAALAG